ncbi:MAG: GIN domain-containing protein [Bacteroidales bacterium]
MKTLIAGAIILLTSFAPVFAGDLKTQILDIKPVNAIEVSSGIEVYISKGKTDKLKIESNIDKLGNLLIRQKGGTLILGYQPGFNRNSKKKDLKTKIYLSSEEIKSIDASSASTVSCQGEFQTQNFKASASSAADIEVFTIEAGNMTVSASSAAEIKLNAKAQSMKVSASSAAEIEIKGKYNTVDCDASSASEIEMDLSVSNLTISASSASDVKVAGECSNFQAKASSGSDIKAARLVADDVKAKASSGSDITVHARKYLDANASSGSRIRCSGNPANRNCNSSGGGTVKIEK